MTLKKSYTIFVSKDTIYKIVEIKKIDSSIKFDDNKNVYIYTI